MGTPRETPREARVDDEVLEPTYSDLSLGPSGRPVATVVLEAMDPGVVAGGTGPGAAPIGTIATGTGPGEATTVAALEVAADSPMRLSTSLSSMERGRTVARDGRRRAPSTASAGTTDARLDRLTGLMEAMLVRMDDERRSQGGVFPAFAEREVRQDDGSQASFHSVPTTAASGGGAIMVEPPDAERPVTPVKPRTPPPMLRVPSPSPPRAPPLLNFPVEEISATRGVRSSTPPPAVFRPPVPALPLSAKSEEPSRYVQALPKLEDYTPDQGAVILGDWLVTITPVIGSLTPGAATWFAEVLARVNEHYALWLASDPVTRLTIRTRAIADGANASSQGGTALLEQRLTTLLLEAVPSAVKTEVITVRALTTVGILFLLHTRYQPAGQAEKASILQFLVSPDAPKDTQQAVKNLRRWLRWLARSTELQLAPPDASLLVKAVDKLGAAFLSDPSAVFRVQAFRLQNSIDHLPSQDSSVSLAQLYLAELETLLLVAPDPKKQRVAALEAPTADKPEEPKGKGKGKEKGAGEAQSQEPEAAGSTLGPSAAQAIRDAATSLRQELLKAIRSAEPGNQVSGALSSSGKGLIDGGATCCLRSAKNTFEWNESTPTSIRLAVGEVTARVSPAGTLLLPPGSSCDPIVALHELIRIGYRMTFLSVNKMRIWRPGQPDLPLDCSTGCPEITPNEANRLITEIENSKRVNRAQVARLTQLPTSSFEDVLQDPSGDKLALWFKGIVPSVPARLLPTLAIAPCKKAAPWNRRRRRTLSRAKHLIIHLFPGQSRGLFRSLTQANLGWDVLEVDIEEDLLREDTFGFLLHLAQTGRVRAVIGGPPCRTFSALHHLSSGLSAATQAMVDQDSALYLRMFMLTSVARRAGRALRRSESPDLTGPEPFCFGMEQPEDPAQVFDASHVEGPTLLSLDQGPLGHAKRKPTTLALLGDSNPGHVLAPEAASSSGVAAPSLDTSSQEPAPSLDTSNQEPAAGSAPPELLDSEPCFADLFDDEGDGSEDLLPVLDAPADPEDLCDPLTPSQTAAADAENEAWQGQFDALTDEWKDSPLPAVPMQDVPFFVPLVSKSGKNVSGAVMQVVTQVRALGLPIHRLHSDRGREFRNASLAHFTRFHCIPHTTTCGDDFKANGRTENTVRLLKRATRTLLQAHAAPTSDWSFAMRHACARLRAAALSALGQPSPKLLPWRARLVLRRRTWSRLAAGSWGSRALMVTVLCPSPDVPGGHLVVTDDGGYLHSDVLVEVGEAVELQEFAGYDIHDRGSQDDDVYYAYVTAEQASILDAQFPDFDNFVCRNLPLSWEKVEPVYPPSPNEHEQVLWDQRFRDWILDPELRFVVAEDPEEAFEERPSSSRGDDHPATTSSERNPPAERSRSRSPRDQHRETPEESEEYLALTVRSCRASGRAALYSFVTPQDGEEDELRRVPQTTPVLDVASSEALAFALLSRPVLTAEAVLGLVQVSGLRIRQSRRARSFVGEAPVYHTFGHYCSPYDTGLTRSTRQRPELTRVLCRVLVEAHPTATFSALAVIGNCQQSCHHDLLNEKGALNYLFPLSSFKGGDLWIEDASVSEEEAVHRFIPSPQGQELRKGKIAYDFVQYNLKKLGRQARHLWGHANDTGDGEEVAELVRSIDHQVCSLERVLDRASSDTAEAPPLLPDAAEKELACFLDEEEETPPPQLCVARAVDPSAATSTEGPLNASPEDSNVPLQTRTVTLVEVLSELELWLPSWKEEYSSLVHQHKAVRPLTQQDVDKWKREGVEYQLIPSKLVHTLKAHTGRRKARCVCCGNMESHSIYHKHECYAGGADATTLRALLRVASAHRWAVSSFDVRTAFLQSRLLTANRVPTVVRVPWLWRKHCICIEEFWLVEGALYGLCISPRSWCESRDSTMASATTTFGDMKVLL
ncbi:UVR8, partial [Symbiodinium necroappetens]